MSEFSPGLLTIRIRMDMLLCVQTYGQFESLKKLHHLGASQAYFSFGDGTFLSACM